MPGRKHSDEEILNYLAQAKALQQKQGFSVAEACNHLGISPQSYYRWKQEHRENPHKRQVETSHIDQEKQFLKDQLLNAMLENQQLRKEIEELKRKL